MYSVYSDWLCLLRAVLAHATISLSCFAAQYRYILHNAVWSHVTNKHTPSDRKFLFDIILAGKLLFQKPNQSDSIVSLCLHTSCD